MLQQTTVPNQRFITITLNYARMGCTRRIFLDLLRSEYEIRKIDLSHCSADTKDIPAKKGDRPAMMAIKKVKGNKLSALVYRNGLPLACTVASANFHDSRLYEPIFEAFAISGVLENPSIISANAAYDAREIHQYNRNRGIRSNILVNRRSRRYPKQGRPFWFGPELYKEPSAVERFLSWLKAFKKIVPRYERYEHSFLGLIYLACSVMIGRILR